MARGKKYTAEQIVNLLRQVEVGVANGKTLPSFSGSLGRNQNLVNLIRPRSGSFTRDLCVRRFREAFKADFSRTFPDQQARRPDLSRPPFAGNFITEMDTPSRLPASIRKGFALYRGPMEFQ